MTNLPKHESSWLSKPELDDYARESSIRESGNLEDIKEYTSQMQRLCRQSFFSSFSSVHSCLKTRGKGELLCGSSGDVLHSS